MIADLLTLLFADSHDEPTFIGGVAVAVEFGAPDSFSGRHSTIIGSSLVCILNKTAQSDVERDPMIV